MPKARLPRVLWRQGLHLEGTVLWFDAPRRHQLSIVSHAHVRVPRGAKVLCTPPTAHLLGLRGPSVLQCEYGQPVSIGPLKIELFPSGHMLGAAQVWVETPTGRVVLTGPLGLSNRPTAEPQAVRRCDVLALECTPEGVESDDLDAARLAAQIDQTIHAGETPVVLALTPGPAQDLLCALPRFSVCAHPAIAAGARAYAELGVRMPRVRTFRGRLRPGEVLLWPAGVRGLRTLERLGPVRILSSRQGACVWPETQAPRAPVDSSSIEQTVEARALGAYAQELAPKKIYLTGSASVEVAEVLGRAGIMAERIRIPRQMQLGFRG